MYMQVTNLPGESPIPVKRSEKLGTEGYYDKLAMPEPAEKALRIVPLLTSTPLTGTGVGFSTSYLYRMDDASSNSQLQAGGQYSDTESLTLFVRNNAFFNGNAIISNTAILPAEINSEFDEEGGEEVNYKIKSIQIAQKLLFRVRGSFYAGGRVFYRNVEYSPNNAAGEDFLQRNGIVDQENGGLGASVSWDRLERSRCLGTSVFWPVCQRSGTGWRPTDIIGKERFAGGFLQASFAPGI